MTSFNDGIEAAAQRLEEVFHIMLAKDIRALKRPEPSDTTDYARGFRAGVEAAAELAKAKDAEAKGYGDAHHALRALPEQIRALARAAPEPSEADVERVARAISETRGCPKEIGQEVAGAWWWDKRHDDPRNEFAHESRKEDLRAARAALAAFQQEAK